MEFQAEAPCPQAFPGGPCELQIGLPTRGAGVSPGAMLLYHGLGQRKAFRYTQALPIPPKQDQRQKPAWCGSGLEGQQLRLRPHASQPPPGTASRHAGRARGGGRGGAGGLGCFPEPIPEEGPGRSEVPGVLAGCRGLCLPRWKRFTDAIQGQHNFPKGQNVLFELFRGGLFTSTEI